MWVLGIKHRWPDLHGKNLYPLSHLCQLLSGNSLFVFEFVKLFIAASNMAPGTDQAEWWKNEEKIDTQTHVQESWGHVDWDL